MELVGSKQNSSRKFNGMAPSMNSPPPIQLIINMGPFVVEAEISSCGC